MCYLVTKFWKKNRQKSITFLDITFFWEVFEVWLGYEKLLFFMNFSNLTMVCLKEIICTLVAHFKIFSFLVVEKCWFLCLLCAHTAGVSPWFYAPIRYLWHISISEEKLENSKSYVRLKIGKNPLFEIPKSSKFLGLTWPFGFTSLFLPSFYLHTKNMNISKHLKSGISSPQLRSL